MPIPERRSSTAGRSFILVLVGMLFGAIGIFMAFTTVRTLVLVAMMQSWPTVPAHLKSVELKEGRRKTSDMAVASYSYEFQGRQYTGNRVSLYSGDNFDNFQRDTYAELNGHLTRQAPYPVHVNPKDPSESILIAVFRWKAIGFYLLFTVAFGGVGWFTLIYSSGSTTSGRRGARPSRKSSV